MDDADFQVRREKLAKHGLRLVAGIESEHLIEISEQTPLINVELLTQNVYSRVLATNKTNSIAFESAIKASSFLDRRGGLKAAIISAASYEQFAAGLEQNMPPILAKIRPDSPADKKLCNLLSLFFIGVAADAILNNINLGKEYIETDSIEAFGTKSPFSYTGLHVEFCTRPDDPSLLKRDHQVLNELVAINAEACGFMPYAGRLDGIKSVHYNFSLADQRGKNLFISSRRNVLRGPRGHEEMQLVPLVPRLMAETGYNAAKLLAANIGYNVDKAIIMTGFNKDSNQVVVRFRYDHIELTRLVEYDNLDKTICLSADAVLQAMRDLRRGKWSDLVEPKMKINQVIASGDWRQIANRQRPRVGSDFIHPNEARAGRL